MKTAEISTTVFKLPEGVIATMGREIQCRRRALGLSGAEFAKKLHVSQQQVSRYECGKTHITVEMLLVILVVLEVSVSDFFRDVGQRLLSEVGLQDVESYRRFLPYENDKKGEPEYMMNTMRLIKTVPF